MRTKSLPASIRHSPPTNEANSTLPKAPPRSSRIRNIIATVPMLVLLPALLIPLLASASGPKLETVGLTTPGSTIVVRGSGFRPDDRLQLTWDGAPDTMPAATTNRNGKFTVKVDVAGTVTLGTHRLEALVVGHAVRGKIDGDAAVAGIDITVARQTPSPSPSAQASGDALPPPPVTPPSGSATASSPDGPLASGDSAVDLSAPLITIAKKGPVGPDATARPKGTNRPRSSDAATPTPRTVATQAPAAPAATPRPTKTPRPAQPVPLPPTAGGTFYVATNGSDGNPGTVDRPFKTIGHALSALGPGSTLYVRGGDYYENIQNPKIAQGSGGAPIHFAAYPGERPVIHGLLWLKNPSFWIIDGINVTWQPGNGSGDHMVKLTGGVGWVLQNSELWGAQSYAALFIGADSGGPSGWVVQNNCIHDTGAVNGQNQDHNIYVNTGLAAGAGTIQRNVLYNAPNGRNIKLGGSGTGGGEGSTNVTITSNTIYGAPQTISLSGGTSNIRVEWNIIANAFDGVLVRAYELSGGNNVVANNFGTGASQFLSSELTDGGGNVMGNAGFNGVGCGAFVPSGAATAYGRWR
jgi:hypothetical protein